MKYAVKIDLGKYAQDLNGKNIKIPHEAKLSEITAGALVNKPHGEIYKQYDWARALHNDGSVEVDETDAKRIHAIVTSDENITLLVKAQILRVIDDAIDANRKQGKSEA